MENSKIKICHVANADIAVKFLLLPQLKFLIKEGYDVYAVCSRGKWVNNIKKEGIKVKTINFKRKISPFSDLVALFKLFLYLRKEKFQIVHTHNPKPGFLGQLSAKIAGTPIIINTIHGFYFDENSSFLKKKFFILIEKISASFSDLILFQSKEDIKTAIKEKICSPGKIKFLGNGINLQKFNPERFLQEFINKKKEELKLDHNFKIIGIIGRLVKEKGYLELFRAFGKIIEKFPKTLLLVIGPEEPAKKDKITQDIIKGCGIEGNVLFLGEREDVDELYPLMDIFILPSYREGFPRTVIEAMAMKKPVIATNIRGCREAVEDGKTGILIPLRNSEKIIEKVIYLFENPDKANTMGEEGREKAEKDFNENQIFNMIKAEYDNLILEKLK